MANYEAVGKIVNVIGGGADKLQIKIDNEDFAIAGGSSYSWTNKVFQTLTDKKIEDIDIRELNKELKTKTLVGKRIRITITD